MQLSSLTIEKQWMLWQVSGTNILILWKDMVSFMTKSINKEQQLINLMKRKRIKRMMPKKMKKNLLQLSKKLRRKLNLHLKIHVLLRNKIRQVKNKKLRLNRLMLKIWQKKLHLYKIMIQLLQWLQLGDLLLQVVLLSQLDKILSQTKMRKRKASKPKLVVQRSTRPFLFNRFRKKATQLSQQRADLNKIRTFKLKKWKEPILPKRPQIHHRMRLLPKQMIRRKLRLRGKPPSTFRKLCRIRSTRTQM